MTNKYQNGSCDNIWANSVNATEKSFIISFGIKYALTISYGPGLKQVKSEAVQV